MTSNSHKESHPDYGRVVIAHGRFRVIVCKDNLQWILQKRGAKSAAGARWRSISYCRSQNTLLRVWTGFQRDSGRTEWPELETLPAKFGGGG